MRGASFRAGAMAAFVLNDTMMNLVFAELELFQAIFLRGLLLSLLLALLGLPRGQLLHRPTRSDAGALALRVTGEIGSSVCFLTALYHMPLANATAIIQVIPLALTLAAALRSEEHTSELQSLMRISYAVFCLKKKIKPP